MTSLWLGIKTLPFMEAVRESADTHVLIRAHQEAVMDVSLHQAGFAHTLLSQHHHFGIHTDGTHRDWVWKR